MEVVRLVFQDDYWQKTIEFAAWAAGKHMALLLRENRFKDWEAAAECAKASDLQRHIFRRIWSGFMKSAAFAHRPVGKLRRGYGFRL